MQTKWLKCNANQVIETPTCIKLLFKDQKDNLSTQILDTSMYKDYCKFKRPIHGNTETTLCIL